MKHLLKTFFMSTIPKLTLIFLATTAEVCTFLHKVVNTLSCPNTQFSKSDFPFIQSKGSLEITESQSADAEPPPPPKPDLSRYTGLRTHLSLATNEGKGSSRSENLTCELQRRCRQG